MTISLLTPLLNLNCSTLIIVSPWLNGTLYSVPNTTTLIVCPEVVAALLLITISPVYDSLLTKPLSVP